MNKQDYDKRIEQYKTALEWFNNTSTCDIVKLQFKIIDSSIKIQPEAFQRWVKINEDINEIWHNGTEEQKSRINSIIEELKYRKCTFNVSP